MQQPALRFVKEAMNNGVQADGLRAYLFSKSRLQLRGFVVDIQQVDEDTLESESP